MSADPLNISYAPMRRDSQTVLLVDDDRMQYVVTRQHFKNFHLEKLEVEWAGTYEEGLTRLEGGGFCACLLDYQLGDRDGLQFLEEIREKGCTLPVIFLTADSNPNVDIKAMNLGAADYLVKGEITPGILERSLRYSLRIHETMRRLNELATQDQLTGLLNRRAFDRSLADEGRRQTSFGHSFSLILIDIDHFKNVNDTYGHLVGDEVLQWISLILRSVINPVHRIARFGGEEFAVVVLEEREEAATKLAEQIRAAVAERPFVGENPEVNLPVTVSLGVAENTLGAGGPDLIRRADLALYAAKAAGRNRVARASGLPREQVASDK